MKYIYALAVSLALISSPSFAQVTPVQKAEILRENQARVDELKRQIMLDTESFKENRRLNNAAAIEADTVRLKKHLKELNLAVKRQERDQRLLGAR